MSDNPVVRIASDAELAGTFPTLLGYTPSPGDVAILALKPEGKVAVSCNVPAMNGAQLVPMSLHAAQLREVLAKANAECAFVFGYGKHAEDHALALGPELGLAPERVITLSIEGEQVRRIGDGVRGAWANITAPNPVFGVDLNVPAPAQDRASLAARHGLITSKQVPAWAARDVQNFVDAQPLDVGERADVVLRLLEHAGPDSGPLPRARIGALLTDNLDVRDAVLGQLLTGDPQLRDNLDYVARTAHPRHLPEVSAVAAMSHYLLGNSSVAADVYARRSEDTSLGSRVGMLLDLGVKPSQELKDMVILAAEDARAETITPKTSVPKAARPARASIDGVNPTGPTTGGPAMGMG